MANWLLTCPTVSEAPFAWNPLMERYRMDRAETIIETSPGEFELVRYEAYTTELEYTGGPDSFLDPIPTTLRYYRGGYEHIVSDQDRTDLINSGVVDASNFQPIP